MLLCEFCESVFVEKKPKKISSSSEMGCQVCKGDNKKHKKSHKKHHHKKHHKKHHHKKH